MMRCVRDATDYTHGDRMTGGGLSKPHHTVQQGSTENGMNNEETRLLVSKKKLTKNAPAVFLGCREMVFRICHRV